MLHLCLALALVALTLDSVRGDRVVMVVCSPIGSICMSIHLGKRGEKGLFNIGKRFCISVPRLKATQHFVAPIGIGTERIDRFMMRTSCALKFHYIYLQVFAMPRIFLGVRSAH